MNFIKLALVACFTFVTSVANADVVVGQAPESVELGNNTSGEPLNLNDYKGKVVAITFVASWWTPGLAEIPVLETLQKKVGKEHLKIIVVSYQDDRRKFNRIANGLKNTLTDSDIDFLFDYSNSVSAIFGVKGIPYAVIIGRDGKVFAEHVDNDTDSNPGNDKDNEKKRFNAIWQDLVTAMSPLPASTATK